MDTSGSFPEGAAYWRLARSAEEACQAASSAASHAGDNDVATRLGTVVSLLYRMACCHWGCHGQHHVFEYLAGRTCTSAHSAYRLIGFGYYDEALSLSRNIAEIGNLVHLFFTDTSHIRFWLDLPDKDRKRNYTPVKVRDLLESLGAVVPTDRDSYSWLCEVGTHVTPRTLPQAHNSESHPVLGATHQPEGMKVSIESLAWSVCTVSAPIAKIAILDADQAKKLFEKSVALGGAL